MWDWTENQIKIVCIRHGATPSNQEHRYLGKTEESLSSEGIITLQQKKCPKVDKVYSSPMKRCIETAQILYPELSPILIPEWEEMDFGTFEGKNYIDLQQDPYYQRWIDSNGTLPFPNGEDRDAFIIRCKKGLERMLDMLSKEGREQTKAPMVLGLVLHGGTIMALFSAFGEGDYFDYQVKNAEGYTAYVDQRDGHIKITQISRLE